MNGLLFLFCCIQILGAVMCGAQNGTIFQQESDTSSVSFSVTNNAPNSMPQTTSLTTAQSSKSNNRATRAILTTARATPSTGQQNNLFDLILNKKECQPVFMVTGGLIIACTILLVSTLLLAWKACQLSRRIKALSSNAELISSSEYWMENAKKNKSKSETEPKETSVLMADLSQIEEETATTKEEAGKVNEDGQMGEESRKEAGDSTSGQEVSATPVAAAENSSTSKPQEEVTDPQPTKAEEASTSEGEKDVV